MHHNHHSRLAVACLSIAVAALLRSFSLSSLFVSRPSPTTVFALLLLRFLEHPSPCALLRALFSPRPLLRLPPASLHSTRSSRFLYVSFQAARQPYYAPRREPAGLRRRRHRRQLLARHSGSHHRKMSYPGEEDGAGRPKLSLQPRGSAADVASATSAKSSRPNPFGAARPREQVIAEREGKKETEVLKEQIQREWKPTIVMTEGQREEKKAAEAELAFAKSELEKEADPLKVKSLRDEISLKEKKLDELLSSFEKLAVQSAQTGGTRRTHERTRRDEERVSGSPAPPQSYGGKEYGGEGNDGYGNFSRGRGRDRDSDGSGSYGDTWGGAKGGRSGGPQPCYTCGEVGHFSRECPSGGSRGYSGNFGGGRSSSGRQCYTCGMEGHFSRECPQAGAGGGGYGAPRGGSYGPPAGGGYGGSYDYNQPGYVQEYPAAYGGQPAAGYGAGYDDRSAGGYGVGSRGGGSYATGRTDYDNRGNW